MLCFEPSSVQLVNERSYEGEQEGTPWDMLYADDVLTVESKEEVLEQFNR